jgi:hypothetical protein
MARPRAADLPRPRAAVRATVEDRVFSEIASTNVKIALAYRSAMTSIRDNLSLPDQQSWPALPKHRQSRLRSSFPSYPSIHPPSSFSLGHHPPTFLA